MIRQEQLPEAARIAREANESSRLLRAGIGGAVLAGLLFLAVLLNGSATLLREDLQSDFYDLQAHSLVEGRWNVPNQALGLEGFHIDGKNYMYFGPFPALLRLPVAAVTHQFDGRLSQLSMLLAFAVAIGFTVRIVIRTRRLVRGSEPVTTLESLALGAFVFVTGASVLLFLATQLIVFHEAEIWGIALALAAFDFIVEYIENPRAAVLIGASALTTAAVLSRPTVGAGPIAALGLLLLVCVFPGLSRLAGFEDASRKLVGGLIVAIAVPVALYAYVNYAKFQTPFGLPFDSQFVTLVSAEHRHVLAVNHDSLFGPQFLPTNLLQYLRPDGIQLTGLWPWVRFPGVAKIIGDVTYDRITPTTSLVAAMPLHAVLAVLGLFAICSPRRARETQVAALRVPVLGAVVGTIPVLVFGFLAQRYLGDFVPLLVLLGAIGLHVAVGWCSRRAPGWPRRLVVGGFALLTVLAIWFGAGLAILFQQVVSKPDADLRSFVRDQFALQRVVPGGAPALIRARTLPDREPLGAVVVVGDCKGVFVSAGFGWRGLERSPSTGSYRLRVGFTTLDRTPASHEPEPLLSAGSDAKPMMFFVEGRPTGAKVFGYSAPDGIEERSRPVRLDPTRPNVVDLTFDYRTQEVAIAVDGKQVLYRTTIPAVRKIVSPPGTVRIGDGQGRLPAPGTFPGTITEVKRTPVLCREITK